MTSFRGELTGVHSMVNYIVKNWEKGTDEKIDVNLELWCDNESVLKAINAKVDSTFVVLCKPKGSPCPPNPGAPSATQESVPQPRKRPSE